MSSLNILLTGVLLFSQTSWGDNSLREEEKKIQEILSGQRTNCALVSKGQGMTPTLNFETLSPQVVLNNQASQVSIQIKVIYYRCQKNSLLEDPSFVVVADPSAPYQYSVEQLDGTQTLIKVNSQKHQFKAVTKAMTSSPRQEFFPARVETNGSVHQLRFDIPLEKLLSSSNFTQLNNGSEVEVSVPILSELSTDYRIEPQTKSNTGFVPGTTMTWTLKFSMKAKNPLKVELVKVR